MQSQKILLITLPLLLVLPDISTGQPGGARVNVIYADAQEHTNSATFECQVSAEVAGYLRPTGVPVNVRWTVYLPGTYRERITGPTGIYPHVNPGAGIQYDWDGVQNLVNADGQEIPVKYYLHGWWQEEGFTGYTSEELNELVLGNGTCGNLDIEMEIEVSPHTAVGTFTGPDGYTLTISAIPQLG
jgi:hypothetical protein